MLLSAGWHACLLAENWGNDIGTPWINEGPPRFLGWKARNAGGPCDQPFKDPLTAFECYARYSGRTASYYVYPALRAPGPICLETTGGDQLLENGDTTVRFVLQDTRGSTWCPGEIVGYANDAIPLYGCPAGTLPGKYYAYPNRITVTSGLEFWQPIGANLLYAVCARRTDPPEQPIPAKEAGAPKVCKGDPCEPFSGNQFERVVDYQATASPLLKLVRT